MALRRFRHRGKARSDRRPDQIDPLQHEFRKAPRVTGKLGRDGKPFIRSILDLDAGLVALAIAKIIGEDKWTPRIRALVSRLEAKHREQESMATLYERAPFYCSGCPHNTSTQVPEGSIGMAGIGCHYMVTWQPTRNTALFTQMGGEGAPWIGAAPFTSQPHIFANMGDVPTSTPAFSPFAPQ